MQQKGWLFPFVLAVILAALSQWILQATQAEKQDVAVLKQGRDFSAQQFVVSSYDKQGQLQSKLAVAHIDKQLEQDQANLQQIELTWYTSGVPSVFALAKRGQLALLQRELRLFDGVSVDDKRGDIPRSIRADRFYFSEKAGVLKSESPVLARWDRGQITAQNVVLRRETKQLEWVGQVRASYANK